MNLKLNKIEIRVLGSLIEKSITTPDNYPMSINSITNACNQKSNRNPIMQMSDDDVQNTVDDLIKKYIVVTRSAINARVAKYAHRFTDTVSKEFSFSAQEIAVLCILFLRGDQTSGEIRSRAGRLFEFQNVAQVDETIRGLLRRDDGPYVIQLPRQTGRREIRYRHLFTDNEYGIDSYPVQNPQELLNSEQRFTNIENRVSQLEIVVQELQDLLK